MVGEFYFLRYISVLSKIFTGRSHTALVVRKKKANTMIVF